MNCAMLTISLGLGGVINHRNKSTGQRALNIMGIISLMNITVSQSEFLPLENIENSLS